MLLLLLLLEVTSSARGEDTKASVVDAASTIADSAYSRDGMIVSQQQCYAN